MSHCDRCDLDDSMCAHSAVALRIAAQERSPTRTRSPAVVRGRQRSTNREWDGERLRSDEYPRAAKHMDQDEAESQLESIWEWYGCQCVDCCDAKRCYLPPRQKGRADLAAYSFVALQSAMDELMAAYPDHRQRPRLSAWLQVVRRQHAAAQAHEAEEAARRADANDLDTAAKARSRSRKPPARWLGRSPSHYSRR